ncbi:large conductance mechanosensitive channel protein MscL [Nocardia alni]|uniref:large conductance mechanosensitive channel protein MscL n=1 Tax=Nocardia alni TaxID=2815723 RepID=UPI001C21B5BD|nr:large conductance mechanosensitive channel protein MscL [Nocardia alni]
MLKGFKEFLLRGNVIDLAVAVVIGTAFTAVITALTKGFINPLLEAFGGTGEVGWGFRIISDKPATYVSLGPIVTAAINFVIIAAIVYFLVVLPASRAVKRWGTASVAATEIELLTEIRDLLATSGSSSGGRHES